VVFRTNALTPGKQIEQRASLTTGGQVIPPRDKVSNTSPLVTSASAHKSTEHQYQNHVLMRLRGALGGVDMQFLVDSGGTHNFVSSSVVRRLGIFIDKASAQSVLLGDGEAHVKILGAIKRKVTIASNKMKRLGCYSG
jgi:hypothetical protein